MPVVGLGSAKSLERGKYDIETLDIEMSKKAGRRRVAPVPKRLSSVRRGARFHPARTA